jgi:hypothetical protein
MIGNTGPILAFRDVMPAGVTLLPPTHVRS